MNFDVRYITAFFDSNQTIIAEAYKAMKKPFIAFVRSHCTQLDEKYLEDVYHDSFIRMQQNILLGKVTADNLSGTLLGYLQGIGFNVAMEMVRKHHEIVEGSAAWNAMISSLEKQACMEDDESRYGMSALWEMEVEEPFTHWCSRHPEASKEEKNNEFDRLTDAFLDKHKGTKSIVDDSSFCTEADTMEDVLQRERDKLIKDCVIRMKEPCAPLLLGAIWEDKTNLDLTIELGYANEDSTKNQKSKCLKKLKSFIKPLLKQYGYDYE